jgi:FixJ family two-component response regulator
VSWDSIITNAAKAVERSRNREKMEQTKAQLDPLSDKYRLIDLYNKVGTINRMALELGCSYRTVQRRMRKAGLRTVRGRQLVNVAG